MNKNILILFLVFLIINRVSAQEAQTISFNHQLTLKKTEPLKRSLFSTAAPETSVRILAVMVAFKEDNDPLTSGNGSFDTSKPSKPYLDAPPHNKEYFQKHITFLENYFRKSSNGKLKVTGTVLDSVFRLPNEMSFYSPSLRDEKNVELGFLAKDTWQLVDTLTRLWGNPIQYDQYDAFLIFHAGVGRDINLSSLYGYTPTPKDIPSIYLSQSGMKEIFGSTFEGIIINNGRDTIKNSIIAPETEAIEGYHFSINGLLAAMVGSHLGLPDLFDTKKPGEGRSGIGRFGLMDGESIFSWFGAFPPEPSAWEKYFLGWIEPITIASSDSIYDFPAVSLNNSVDTVYKVLINAKEYFLVENRNRDANRDSTTVTIFYNGETLIKKWAHDIKGFNEDNQDSLYGVVIDVDEFDWSLPGGYDSKNNILYDGGILIWHIDENIIEANLAANTINSDPNRRGVNLMEADGAQDIGQIYDWLTPWKNSSSGWLFDFWYKGNQAPLRKYDTTGFTPFSHPSSMSNNGANSHIYINNFSERSPRMKARIKVGDEHLKPLSGFPKYIGTRAANQAPQIIDDRIFITNGDSIFVFLKDGRSGTTSADGLLSNFGGNFPVGLDFFISQIVAYGVQDSAVHRLKLSDLNQDNIFDSIEVTTIISSPTKITTAPVINGRPGWGPNVLCGNESGFLLSYEPTSTQFISNSALTSISSYSIYPGDGLIGPLLIFCTTNDTFDTPFGDFALPHKSNKWELVTSSKLINQSDFYVIADIEGQTVLLYDYFNLVRKVNLYDGNIKGIAISDLDNDGSRDVIITAGKKIYAFNRSGVILDYFPISVSDTITNPPIIADVDGDGLLDVLVSTKNNLISAYSVKGKPIYGFPISISNSSISTMSITPSRQITTVGGGTFWENGLLAAMSTDGYLYAWELPNVKSVTWGNYRGNLQHTAFENSQLTGKPPSAEFLPSYRAYNWPNPVTAADDFKTHIRYFVSEDAKVHIRIFDPAGDLVDKFDGPGRGGFDNEVEWNVSNIQSGIYFAHIQANGVGKSGYAIIKIAVVR